MGYKFDECVSCRFKRRKDICAECDCGEQFEDSEIPALNFTADQMFRRAERPLTNDDDEIHFNPDDLIRKIDQREEDGDDEEEPNE